MNINAKIHQNFELTLFLDETEAHLLACALQDGNIERTQIDNFLAAGEYPDAEPEVKTALTTLLEDLGQMVYHLSGNTDN